MKLLAPVLTAENCDELLQAARFKSKRQVECMLAQRFPRPDVPSVIRKLPAKPSAAVGPVAAPGALQLATVLVPENSNSSSDSEPIVHRQPSPSLQLAPAAGPAIAPLCADRYKVQFTANQRLHDKLEQAQDLLRHLVPDGDLAAVVERALDLLIAERLKQRFAMVRRPRARTQAKPKSNSRHVPHEVRREVITRDGVRCSYVSATGKGCEQRGWLQLHHEEPFARGGHATASNIRPLCRAHNQLLAERDFGRSFVKQRISQARAERSAADSSRDG